MAACIAVRAMRRLRPYALRREALRCRPGIEPPERAVLAGQDGFHGNCVLGACGGGGKYARKPSLSDQSSKDAQLGGRLRTELPLRDGSNRATVMAATEPPSRSRPALMSSAVLACWLGGTCLLARGAHACRWWSLPRPPGGGSRRRAPRRWTYSWLRVLQKRS